MNKFMEKDKPGQSEKSINNLCFPKYDWELSFFVDVLLLPVSVWSSRRCYEDAYSDRNTHSWVLASD